MLWARQGSYKSLNFCLILVFTTVISPVVSCALCFLSRIPLVHPLQGVNLWSLAKVLLKYNTILTNLAVFSLTFALPFRGSWYCQFLTCSELLWENHIASRFPLLLLWIPAISGRKCHLLLLCLFFRAHVLCSRLFLSSSPLSCYGLCLQLSFSGN